MSGRPREALLPRLLRKVRMTANGCWLYGKSGYRARYPVVSVNGQPKRANRAVWEAIYGGIPPGLAVLHNCDCPLCVNPLHLFLGTQADNAIDMMVKGRGQGQFQNGHPYYKAGAEVCQ